MWGIYGTQIMRGQFSLKDSLFGIPFLLITIAFSIQIAMHLAGHVSVTRIGDECVVFTGIGTVGWEKRFQWPEVRSVGETGGWSDDPPEWWVEVTFVSGKKMKFGSMLSKARREFLLLCCGSSSARDRRENCHRFWAP